MTTLTEAPTLTLTRHFRASPADVFAAWTDPEVFAAWMGPGTMTCRSASMDLTPGGAWEARIFENDGEPHICFGAYRLIDAPRQLVFTMQWRQGGGGQSAETEVDITFEAEAGGTRMTLVQSGFATEQARDNHGRGWGGSLAKLEARFS